MKYKLLIAHNPKGLSEIVNRHMAREWLPVGGIAIYDTGVDGISYYQAMKMGETGEVVEAELIAEK